MKENHQSNRKPEGLRFKDFYNKKQGRKKIFLIALALLTSAATLGFAVRAFNHNPKETRSPEGVTVNVAAKAAPTLQARLPTQGRFFSRLVLQPEADKLRRRIGQRFLSPGRERSTLIGFLTLGAIRQPVLIIRSQEDEGETISISINAQPALKWIAGKGVQQDGKLAIGTERAVAERLLLDSPDQFILAQLRGASYATIGEHVVPAGAAEQEDYSGPTWKVIRVGEPPNIPTGQPLSLSRVYYLNTVTGLIDKVVSKEAGDIIVAELSVLSQQ